MGAGSVNPLTSEVSVDGVIKGRTVDKASGNRRVRNSCEAWRYALVILLDDGREDVVANDDIEFDMELESTCDPKFEAVGLSVAV